MFAVCYIIVFAFHPELKLERVIIEQSYRHSLVKLLTVDYLKRNHFLQLRDAAIAVANSRDKLAISTIFNIELKVAPDTLLKRFNMKIKSKNLVIDPEIERRYEITNPIN